MSRMKIALKNIVIIITMFLIFIYFSGLYFTPLSAHESSERSIHYGPSEVVHIEDFEEGKYILGKYDKWVSCNTVNKQLLFFWGFGSQVTGFENDKTKTLDYSWSISHEYNKYYGIRNDVNINKVEITLKNGEIHTTTDFYNDLFIIAWKTSGDSDIYVKNIKGYDSFNNVIFEENS